MSNNQKQYTFTLPVGTILTGGQNSYHIEEVLGQGGYGITYKVWAIIKNGQIPVKVPFAIKEHFVNGRCHRAADGVTVEYSQEAAEDVEESLKDFVKEGRLLNKICQVSDEAVRYIVPVNEVIEVNNTAYFVMQYLEGGSLRRMVLNSGALPEEKALALIKPIVRAVDFIHRHKVLHMDIKPENIVMHRNLLTGQEEPVLIDFGVSLHFNKKGGLTSKHTSFGHTEGFSPIEQYGAVETFAPWIDVYALGATLYYLLTGKTPPKAFDMTPDNVDKNLPPEVSKRTRAAIKHAMTKDYHDRTQSASTFLWELENDYEPIVVNKPLSAGFILHLGNSNYQIVAVSETTDYFIRYTAVKLSDSGDVYDSNLTIRKSYFVYEYFANGVHQRQKDNTVVEISSVLPSKEKFLALTSKRRIPRTNAFESNGTIYLVQEGIPPVPPTPKRKWTWLLAACVVVLFVVFKAIPNGTTDANKHDDVDTVHPHSSKEEWIDLPPEEDSIEIIDTLALVNTPAKEVKSDGNSGQSQDASKPRKAEKSQPSSKIEAKQEKIEKPEPKAPTDAEIFEQAYKAKDWKTIEKLGNKGYAKAYYPLALHYYNTGVAAECEKWSRKAINAGVQTEAAKKLLNEVQ